MRKKKKKKKFFETKYLLFGLLIIFIIFLIFLLVKNIFISQNEGFKIKSHVGDVKESVKKNDNDLTKTIGWVEIPGTEMNMPIFRITDKYSVPPVEKSKFSWTLSQNTGYQKMMVVFGHNIYNLGVPKVNDEDFVRFEQLMAYVYEDFAKEHEYFQITIDGKDYGYKIFSVSLLDAYSVDVFSFNDGNKNDMKRDIKKLKEKSIYDYDVNVSNDDDIVVLSTCTRLFGDTAVNYDIVVAGRLIKDNESNFKYSLSKNDNYNKIKKYLKGDENDATN